MPDATCCTDNISTHDANVRAYSHAATIIEMRCSCCNKWPFLPTTHAINTNTAPTHALEQIAVERAAATELGDDELRARARTYCCQTRARTRGRTLTNSPRVSSVLTLRKTLITRKRTDNASTYPTSRTTLGCSVSDFICARTHTLSHAHAHTYTLARVPAAPLS
jgi:hypothetical protein